MRNIPWYYTSLGESERAALIATFDERRLTTGPVTQNLENALGKKLGVPYVVVTNSGTSALSMALIAAGVGAGDEVLVPNISWIATAQAASILGAKVVLIDTVKDLPIMDVSAVEAKITSLTKPIVPVQMNGRFVDILRLCEICKKHDIAIIEDACKALFSMHDKKFMGTFGDMGCYSLGMISMLPSAYGGVVVTSDKALFEKLRVIRWHGVESNPDENYVYPAFNFKCSDLFSALALNQLDKIDAKIERVKNLYQKYAFTIDRLRNIKMVPVRIEDGELPLLIDVRVERREIVTSRLKQIGIGTCNFHPPLHFAKYLKNSGVFPNSTALATGSFHLPCGPDQKSEDIDFVLSEVKKLDQEISRKEDWYEKSHRDQCI